MASHMEIINGRMIPSVTTILKDMQGKEPIGLRIWRENLIKQGIDPAWELDRTSKIGTVAHFRILAELSPVKLEAPDFPFSSWPVNTTLYAKRAQDIFNKWLDDTGYAIRRPTCEFYFCNPELGYCGTADIKCEIDGINTIIDLKTSKAVNDKHLEQVSAYARHFEADQGIVLCVCPYEEKNPKFNWVAKEVDDAQLDRLYDDFSLKCRKWHAKFNSDQIL